MCYPAGPSWLRRSCGRDLVRRELPDLHMTRFVFVTGGVVSSLGKGIAAASLGAILEARGLKIAMRSGGHSWAAAFLRDAVAGAGRQSTRCHGNPWAFTGVADAQHLQPRLAGPSGRGRVENGCDSLETVTVVCQLVSTCRSQRESESKATEFIEEIW